MGGPLQVLCIQELIVVRFIFHCHNLIILQSSGRLRVYQTITICISQIMGCFVPIKQYCKPEILR